MQYPNALPNWVQMKTIETSNDEDSNIWRTLEEFDFSEYKTNSELRVALYQKLLDSIGYCFSCANYVKSTSWCKLLETRSGVLDRCCDFERVEKDDKSPFDVMVEPFVEEQKRASDAVRINKYTHWSNKAGSGKPKEEHFDGYEKPEEEDV